MDAAYMSDGQIAKKFGRSYKWLRTHRAKLQSMGFPHKCDVVGLTLAADVDAWLAKQRKVDDRGQAARLHHITTPSSEIGINYDAL